MLDEKQLFLEKCSKKDREKLLGKCKMSFEDFERFLFLTESLGLMEYKKEIFNSFIPEFRERYTELIKLWSMEESVWEEIEENIIKREEWLEKFLEIIE